MLSLTAVGAGWLAGAVVAEARRPGPGGALPSWLRRMPAILAAAGAGGTAVMLAAGREPAVLAWGVGALACAGLVHLAHRFITRREATADLGAAFARQTAGPIAGVGVALTVACLAGQADVVRDHFFDATGSAFGVVGTLWALGGISAGWFVAAAVRGNASAGRLRLPVGGTAVALCVATAGILGYAWRHDRPPYPASALQATVTIRLTDATRFDEDARAVGAPGLDVMGAGNAQPFVGRLDYRLPAGADADGSYHLVVIDKRRDEVAGQLYDADGGDWNGFYNDLPRRYPWLSAMAPTWTGSGYLDAGMAVSVSAGTPGPVSFVGSFTEAAGVTPADLLVVLIFSGPDSQTYWAHPVAITQ